MTAAQAFEMSHSEFLLDLAKSLAIMRVQHRKGLISKDVLKGGIKMVRMQVNQRRNSKYSKPRDYMLVLRLAIGMFNAPMANERYDWEMYQ